MDFTPTQLDLLFGAWATARDGNGLVIEHDAYSDAHRLAEAGWLERRFAGDELAWFWTPQAEHALDINALMQTAAGREN